MDASGIKVTEKVPASRKLGRDDAQQIAKAATRVVVAKGKKVDEFTPKGKPTDDLLTAMLGSTGNLRAPTLIVGKTVLVGFNEAEYEKSLL